MDDVVVRTADFTLPHKLVCPNETAGPAPGVIFIHGWESNQQGYLPRAAALAALGIVGMTFDLRGHGDSPLPAHARDRRSIAKRDFLADALAAYDFLAAQPQVDRDRIGVVGASLGGYLAALLASRRLVRWLALRAPADYPHDELGSAVAALRTFRGDLLIVESGNDAVIPHEVILSYARSLHDSSNVTVAVIEGAAHELHEDEWRRRFIDILTDWFGRRVARSS
jgi:uncharacterized protein